MDSSRLGVSHRNSGRGWRAHLRRGLLASVLLSMFGCGDTEPVAETEQSIFSRHGHGFGHGHHPHAGRCRPATFEGREYLFCPRDKTWRDARRHCQDAGMDLVTIDSQAENDFVRSKIHEDSFIGASDAASEGHWTWSGTGGEFWTGGPNGTAIGDAYENWGRGEPSWGSRPPRHHRPRHHRLGSDCGVIEDHRGKWDAIDCRKHTGFVCEKTDDCPASDKFTAGQCGCATLDTDTDGDGTADCVDACPLDPEKTLPGVCGCAHADIDTDGDGFLDCQDSCPEDPTNVCRTETTPPPVPPVGGGGAGNDGPVTDCIPPAALPAPIEPPIDGDPVKGALFQIAAAVMLTTAYPFGEACGMVQDKDICPLDPSTLDLALPCERDPDGRLKHEMCAGRGADYRCGYGTPPSCTSTPELPECQLPGLFCGLRDAECMADPPLPGGCTNATDACCAPDGSNCSCTEFPVCGEPGSTGNPGPNTPYTTEPAPTETDIGRAAGNNPPQPPTGTYHDPEFPDVIGGCGADPCWCHYRMGGPGPIDEIASQPRTHGQGSSVNVNFTPESSFTATVFPRAFGETEYDLTTERHWNKRVLANFDGATGNANALDARPVERTTTCSLSTLDTSFVVMDKDFVHLSTAEPVDVTPTTNEASLNCANAMATYVRSADRAKKAVRDVQILLREHNGLPEDTTFEKTSFCAGAGPETTDDPGFPTWACDAVPILTSINRYVEYAETTADALKQSYDELTNWRGALEAALGAVAFGPTETFSHGREYNTPLIAITVFIGPVPVTVSLEIALSYNVLQTMEFRFTPLSVLALPLTGDTRPKAQLVTMGGSLGISGSAAFVGFVGLGFDEFFGFSVSAGLRGSISIVNPLTVNLKAGAGLTVESLGDERPTPADMVQDLGAALDPTGETVMPARQTTIYMDWFLYGDLNIQRVLAGDMDVRVRLAAPLIGSKIFKEPLLQFDGFGLNDPPLVLFNWGSRNAGSDQPEPGVATNSLGTYEMESPLPVLRPLPETPDPPNTVPFSLPPAPDGTPLHFNRTCQQDPR